MAEQLADVNPFDPTFKALAFPAYAQLRTIAPVHRIALPDGRAVWLVTGYEEGQTVLKEHHRFANDPMHALTAEEWQQLIGAVTVDLTPEQRELTMQMHEALGRSLLDVDPPDHTRLRKLVARSFTPRFIEGMRPRIQEIADVLIDAIDVRAGETGDREVDLISAFAFPLPITVIAEMLGVPVADRDKFRAWSNTAVRANPAGPVDPAVTASLLEFADYLRALRAEKLRHPADDLVSGLVEAAEDGDALSENELLSMLFLLIVAGHETTVNLIGNGMLALFDHPDQMALLKREPDRIKPAIEEMLRYYGPVEISLVRMAREDLELGGQPIKRGEQIQVVLAAADRDPKFVAEPERFDVTREPTRHLAFGTGIHACLGAPLARLEGEIAFTSLLTRLPNLRLATAREELTWAPGVILRGLTGLPVAF